jgi:hypothetical protein
MRNLQRYELEDPAKVFEHNRNRDRARIESQDWRQAIRDQQNPQPKQDRYSAMYERLILKRGNDYAGVKYLCAESIDQVGRMAVVG